MRRSFFFAFGIFLILMVGSIIWFWNRDGTTQTGGRIVASAELVDFGDIDQGSEPVSAVVELKNNGDTLLEIYRISTSCGCTTAHLDDPSPLAPGASRTLTIQFDPMVHQDEQGPITRAVYIQSSDPDRSELIIDVIGNVVPAQEI